uniref:Antigen 5-related salivary protein n=1 Tax=Phlebotomus orientalis TaxID=99786 RepID=V5K5P1_PHLOR|nr:antigen 5-related salivary protein [Phlebotomus orientalis]AGT96456.1 antigen 5-related salivary protein [Phlebotomus orientalis]
MLQIKHFLFFVVLFVVVHANDYCQPKLCTNGKTVRPHIGCKNNGDFDRSACPNDAELLEMTQQRKDLFLKIHNRLRDRFARGSVPNFKSAAKMPVLKWDNELAKLAEYNVRTCKFAHDQCRATTACPYAGQNLGQMLSSPDYLDPGYAIKNITREWFLEYQWANQERTNTYTAGSGKNGKQIGHFTAFVHEKSDKVGCAVAKLTNRQFNMKQYLIACNYCYTNMMNERVYSTGAPCSKCQSKKCDSKYKNLCDASEKVEPIPDIFLKKPRT